MGELELTIAASTENSGEADFARSCTLRTKHIYALAAFAVVLATGAAIWLLFLREPMPEWKTRLLAQPDFAQAVNPSTSPEYAERLAYLSRDLAQREHWGKNEVDDMLAMLHGSPLDLVWTDSETPQREIDRFLLSFLAQAIIRTRIGIGAPIEDSQRDRLIDALLERSYAAAPMIREGLAEAFCWSGLIFEDERVDARVREMMNDPEPKVAANAKSQYRFHSDGREKWAEYQRRQGRDISDEDG